MGFLCSGLVLPAPQRTSLTDVGLSKAFEKRVTQVLESQRFFDRDEATTLRDPLGENAALLASSFTASVTGLPTSSGFASLQSRLAAPQLSDHSERANV